LNYDYGFGPRKLTKVLAKIYQLRRQLSFAEDRSAEIAEGKLLVTEILEIPYSGKISRRDTRFRKELRLIHESIVSTRDLRRFIAHPVFSLRVQAIRRLRDKINQAMNVTVEEELLQILSGKRNSKIPREIVTLRIGLYGHQPRTLEFVAKEFGITKERVRQMTSASVALRTDQIFSPVAIRSLKVVEEELPILGSKLKEKLCGLGLLDRRTSPQCLKGIANALGIRTKWRAFAMEGDYMFSKG